MEICKYLTRRSYDGTIKSASCIRTRPLTRQHPQCCNSPLPLHCWKNKVSFDQKKTVSLNGVNRNKFHASLYSFNYWFLFNHFLRGMLFLLGIIYQFQKHLLSARSSTSFRCNKDCFRRKNKVIFTTGKKFPWQSALKSVREMK